MTADDLHSWNDGAGAYLAVASETDAYKQLVDDPAFLLLLGDVKDKRVLDVGCGDGTFCRKLRAAGASATGVDGAPNMIAAAQSSDPQGTYVVADLLQPLPLDAASFEIVTSKMLLHNLASVETAARNVYRVLTDGGLFAVNVLPPFRTLVSHLVIHQGKYNGTGDYFHQQRGTIDFAGRDYMFYYRPISQYVNEILAAGFTLCRMNEVGVDEAFAKEHPEEKTKFGRPASLHLLFRK